MGYALTMEELSADVGTATADGVRNIANAAANFVCSVQQNNNSIISSLGVANNPISQAEIAFTNRLCAPRGMPIPPPSQQFPGGQCPKRYNVGTTYTSDQLGTHTGVVTNVLGPIQGTVMRPKGADRVVLGVQGAPDPPTFPDGFQPFLETPKNQADNLTGNITGVTPTSGGDTCGNPPPGYQPHLPPPGSLNPTTNINLGNGIIVPVTLALIPTLVEVNASFSPTFNVDVGGINVNFDAGGVTINVGNNTGKSITSPDPALDPRPNPPAPKPIKPQDNSCDLSPVLSAIAGVKTDVANVKTELDDVKDCSCPVTFTRSTINLGSGNAGTFALPSLTESVTVTLTQIPLNAKRQRAGTEPDFLFCGYFAFGDGVGREERRPLSGERNVLFPPPGATSFSYALYVGYLGTVAAVKKVPAKSGSEAAISQLKAAAK